MKKAMFFVVFIFSFIIVGLNLVKSEGITDKFTVTLNASFDSENGLEEAIVIPNNNYGSKVSLSTQLGTFEGYSLAFWIVNDVVRYDLAVDHEFIVTGDLDIVAVFDNEDENPVVFMDSNGELINIQYVNNGEDADAPETGSYVKPGYAAVGWSKSHLAINEPTVLVLQYSIDTTSEFLVTVNLGNGTGEYLFNTIVTVTPESMGTFSHWEIDGKIVSYDEIYSFTVFGSTEITAIFKESPEVVKPLITLGNALELHSGNKSFVGQFEFPEGYNLIDYGMITSLTAGSIELGDEGVVKHTGFKYVSETNEFLMTFGEESDYEVYRAYLVVEDDLGDLHYYYSRSQYFTDLQVTYLDFEDATKGSYAAESVTLSGNTWRLDDALIGEDANDRKIDSKSLRVQNSGYIASEFVFYGGVTDIFFLHGKYGTQNNSVLYVEYAYEWAPSTWIRVSEAINVDQTYLQQAHITLNIQEPIYIRVVKASGGNPNIDSLIVNYSEYTDDVLPTINVPSNYTIQFSEALDPIDLVLYASDNIDGIITHKVSFTVLDSDNEEILTEDFTDLSPGTYYIVYSVTDENGNFTQRELVLTKMDSSKTVIYSIDFGTSNVTGYAGDSITFTNNWDQTQYVFPKLRAQINTFGTNPAIILSPHSTAGTMSYIEFDLTDLNLNYEGNIVQIEFDFTAWSSTAVNNIKNANRDAFYGLQVWDPSIGDDGDWVSLTNSDGVTNLKSNLTDSYQTVTYNISFGARFRIILDCPGSGTTASNTAQAGVIDNFVVYVQ